MIINNKFTPIPEGKIAIQIVIRYKMNCKTFICLMTKDSTYLNSYRDKALKFILNKMNWDRTDIQLLDWTIIGSMVSFVDIDGESNN